MDGEREGKKHQSIASHAPPTWGPGPQPRHVPWLGIIQWPFSSQAGAQYTEPHQPGQFYMFFPIWRFTYFYCSSSTVISIYPPIPPTPTIPTYHPWSYPPLVLSMCPLYMFLKTSNSPFPPIIPFYLRSGHCQFVLYFQVSGSTVVTCLVYLEFF